MKYHYDRDTDSLAIVFAEGRRYAESEEIFDSVVVDFDSAGKPIAIEFHDRASRFVDTAGLASGREVHIANPDAALGRNTLNGAELRRFRQELGFTQADLAVQLSVGTNTIARWERDELRIENPRMLRLALERLMFTAKSTVLLAEEPFVVLGSRDKKVQSAHVGATRQSDTGRFVARDGRFIDRKESNRSAVKSARPAAKKR
jgi:transcriptional regulator with XRE-family HTH domain/uncharacterized protein YuzE